MKLTCPVVEDLLPFYHDKTCSEESHRLVEEHLATCQRCRYTLSDYQEIIPYSGQEKKILLHPVETYAKNKRKRDFFGGTMIAVLVLALFTVGIFLIDWYVDFPVSVQEVEVSEVSQLMDGSIIFHIYLDNNKQCNFIRHEIETDGTVYVTPMRSIIQMNRKANDDGLYDVYYVARFEDENNSGTHFLPKDTPAIYVGPPGKAILVWENGQELPPASERLEKIATTDDVLNLY